LQDRSFIRLQDISLAYDFKDRFKRLEINNLRAYISAKHLYTLTKWDGYDPETGLTLGNSGVPSMKTFIFGIDISF
jgi:TonB-dependent starch-binding outer membrane protein SusC